MSDYHDVDAEELWQLINNYAQDGFLLERRIYKLSADGNEKIPDDRFWPFDKEGNHIGGWWPEKQEVQALISEGILEPEQWQETTRLEGADRKYKLTAEGQRLA
jgi:hypothetical protein